MSDDLEHEANAGKLNHSVAFIFDLLSFFLRLHEVIVQLFDDRGELVENRQLFAMTLFERPYRCQRSVSQRLNLKLSIPQICDLRRTLLSDNFIQEVPEASLNDEFHRLKQYRLLVAVLEAFPVCLINQFRIACPRDLNSANKLSL